MTQDTAGTQAACACGGGGCGSDQAPPPVNRGARTELTGTAVTATVAAAEPNDIDVRTIPHEHRHARVIGQVMSLVPGEALVVAAPHAPERLLAQIDAEVTGELTSRYLQQGPDLWRVEISRVTCC